MKKKLSIVVPVYNVEKYLEKCLMSLVSQDLKISDYEIIVVNDGSKDNSELVALKFSKNYSNIKLINKENGGVSTARNRGIDIARGEYIMFVDGDDYIEENILNYLVDFVISNKLEVGLFGIRNEGDEINCEKKYFLESKVTGIDLYYNYRNKTGDSSCTYLFSRNFLITNKLSYLEDVPFLEDGEFLARVLCMAESCGFNGYPFYIRVLREGSVTSTNFFNTKRAIDGFIKAAVNLKKFKGENHLVKHQKIFLNQPIAKFVIAALTACTNRSSLKYLYYVVNKLKYFCLNKIEIIGCNEEYKKMVRIYNISIYYFFMYRFLSFALLSLKNNFHNKTVIVNDKKIFNNK